MELEWQHDLWFLVCDALEDQGQSERGGCDRRMLEHKHTTDTCGVIHLSLLLLHFSLALSEIKISTQRSPLLFARLLLASSLASHFFVLLFYSLVLIRQRNTVVTIDPVVTHYTRSQPSPCEGCAERRLESQHFDIDAAGEVSCP